MSYAHKPWPAAAFLIAILLTPPIHSPARGDPGHEPVDPGACAACVAQEEVCEDACDQSLEMMIYICLSSLPPEPPQPVIDCLHLAEEWFDNCVDDCGEEGALCAARNHCPVVATQCSGE